MSSQSFASSLLEIVNELLEPNDFNISTWMAMGATLTLLAQCYLPASLGSSLPILYLSFRLVKMIIDTFRLHTGCFTNMMRGRWTATLSDPSDAVDAKNSSDGIVMFVLGARLNHPLQKLAPGASELNDIFQDMWREAEKNRQKWGCKSHHILLIFASNGATLGAELGRTATLVDFSDGERTPTIWLSYWKDLKGLQEFSNSAAHRLGQNRYNANKYPYIGIMHETFYAPKGCWETINCDFPPWGLGNREGKAKYAIKEESERLKLRDTLKPASRRSSMFSRMGREKVRE